MEKTHSLFSVIVETLGTDCARQPREALRLYKLYGYMYDIYMKFISFLLKYMLVTINVLVLNTYGM